MTLFNGLGTTLQTDPLLPLFMFTRLLIGDDVNIIGTVLPTLSSIASRVSLSLLKVFQLFLLRVAFLVLGVNHIKTI